VGRNAVLPISIVSTRDIHTRTSRGGVSIKTGYPYACE